MDNTIQSDLNSHLNLPKRIHRRTWGESHRLVFLDYARVTSNDIIKIENSKMILPKRI